jgi:hypothetical protein
MEYQQETQVRTPEAPERDGSLQDTQLPDRGPLHPVLQLQQSVGNRALQRLVGNRGVTLQPKLIVGAADDPYEREADRVAQQVVSLPAPASALADRASVQRQAFEENAGGSTKPLAATISPLLERAPEEDGIRAETIVQRASFHSPGSFEPGTDFESRLSTSGDSPLPASARAFMEPRFGADFSRVRLHTGSEAAGLTRSIHAEAFTQGHDIYLGEGKDDIESSGGKHLLAHELTHTIQQGSVGTFDPNAVASHGSPGSGRVQRYESYEHAELGDKAKFSEKHIIQGIELTSGEIDALGDFYATLNDLQKADPGELTELLRLIRKQKADPRSVIEDDWDKATKKRYTELNLKNWAHFAPPNPALIASQSGTSAGADNRSTWGNYHSQALGLARSAGAYSDPAARKELLASAKITNAFGEHYLVDMFSAGHLFNKTDTVAVVQKGIKSLSSKELGLVFRYAADWVWGIQGLRDLISQYEATAWHHANINSADRFKTVLEGIHEKRPEVVASTIVKYVHDQLSTWNASGAPGVQVENDFASWLLSGDKTLRGNVETQNWAGKAIEQARANIQTASQNTTSPSASMPAIPTDEEMSKQVLAYVPRPTADSTQLIHDLLAKVTDPKNVPEFGTAVAKVIAGDLPSLLNAVVDEKKLRKIKP